MKRVFGTKVDAWIAAVIVFGTMIPLVMLAVIGFQTHQYGIIPAGLFAPILIGLFAIPIKYELQSDLLLIHSGIIKYRVRYSDIELIEPTRNPLSSPAMSLDRLKIVYGKRKMIMISPNDRAVFLSEIKKRADLEGTNDRLVRRVAN